ncbi:MAG: FAD-dependent oxidoreductase [Gemmatimonadales bacterium]|jgi:flavin-dependent dehydrogenase|nr:FAD-dependent oxidoreductase [Gemmatimonadota bacterium]MBK6780378.1 FAD-dependent oxidoreductase [Gemmatimonadota bacterium]MBK9691695.1 FAD-dependent oxidoreductase [Gemmatimonadota bacterium]MBP6668853.1 FAD-dependent oxidoreductase [Gemmatimonadales bacterium]MBP9199683.1 FAD-dependent oxidoreductase [Gemmatimonadales bacterium]
MGSSPLDVLIVGAGPAGAATAWHLARAGLAVQLVDRARFPRDKPCSEYLSPEAVRQLDRLGVLARVEREGAPILGTTVVGPRGATLTGRFAGAAVPPWRDTGLAIARRVLDHALVEAAAGAGARLQEGLAVEALLHEAGGVAGAVLRDAAGRRAAVRARLVIGADGLRSVVARRLGGSAPAGLGGLARIAFVAHVAGVPGLEGLTEMHVGDDGYVGLNRLTRDGVANVALVVPARRAAAARGDAPGFFFRELARYPGVRGRVDPASLTRRVLVTGPFASRARRVVADGALLVGDAADFFDPFTGEGICSALRGAELAAAAAMAALAHPGPVTRHALAPYLRARRAAFLGRWTIERLVGYGMLAPRLFDRVVDRLHRRGLADTFIGVTGDFVPARAVLNPWFLSRMVL